LDALNDIDSLPLPLKVIAKGFLSNANDFTPEIYQCSPDEVVDLLDKDDLVFQIIIDKAYESYYIVAVGEKDRVYQSTLIEHNPFHIKRASLYFAPVSSDWIYAMRSEINNEKQIYGEAVEWDPASERYATPFQYSG
jgi:hypothetical protein